VVIYEFPLKSGVMKFIDFVAYWINLDYGLLVGEQYGIQRKKFKGG
jgi:hypothetical protein